MHNLHYAAKRTAAYSADYVTVAQTSEVQDLNPVQQLRMVVVGSIPRVSYAVRITND